MITIDYLQLFNNWAKGDIIQARFMIGSALVAGIPLILFSIRTSNEIGKGMIIPLGLLSLILFSYGSYLSVTKPKEIERTEKHYIENQKLTIKEEKVRLEKDNRSYVAFKRIWISLFVVFALLHFLISSSYFQGLSLGFAFLFSILLITDIFFHARLKVFLSFVQELNP